LGVRFSRGALNALIRGISRLTITIKPALTATVESHRPPLSARSIASAASSKALDITWEYISMVIES
jgi:hypothetical protein